MPVALRTRNWEDHVTSHSRKQYSYDDLDLVCCYAGVAESRSPTGRRWRERCASMPECCPHTSCPVEERNRRRKMLSGTFKGIAVSYGCDSQSVTKGHTFVTVRQAMADDHTIQSKDSLSSSHHSACIPKHSLYKSLDELHKKNKEISREAMATPSGSSSTYAVEEQNEKLNFSSTESETNNGFKDNAKINITMTTESSEKPETGGEPTVGGNIGDPVRKASLLHPQQEIRVDVEVTDIVSVKNDPEFSLVPHTHSDAITSDLASDIRQSEKSQIPQNNVVVIHSSIPNSANDQVVTSHEVLQAHNLDASIEPGFFLCISGSTNNPDRSRDSYTKLDPIPKVFFTKSWVEAEILGPVKEDTSNPHIPTTLVDLKGDLSGVLPDCESSAKSKMETSDCLMIPQTSQSKHDEERDPKPQKVLVRLRTQKSSGGDKERERSQLDSMILLLMKLDQLDQEIGDALGSALSPKDTPSATSRFVSEVDLVSLDGDGSLSGSLRSLGTPHHQSSSSLCSVRNRTSAALSGKDRAA